MLGEPDEAARLSLTIILLHRLQAVQNPNVSTSRMNLIPFPLFKPSSDYFSNPHDADNTTLSTSIIKTIK